ncbi:hypothetical protein BX666DRAFT_2029494 [Dichotomocladium elegans]|nr:hypothetical protein BX666DRAFT_2029494 [Dichotomocladium elegans]
MDKKISDSITAENPATATAVTTALSIKRSGSLTKKLTDQASHYFRLVKKKSFRSLHGRNPKTTAIEATVVDARHNDGNIPRICRADVRVRIKEAPANLAQPLRAKIEEFAAATAATAGSLRSSSSNNGGSAADEDLALAALGKPIPCRPGSHGMSPPPSPPLSFDTLVQRGIRYHERGELDNATAEFAQAAKERSSVGMFFYGLSLCHGWGCEPQQDLGYLYLSKSASSGHPHILNIEHVLGGTSSEELLAAIYKLGTTFQSGNQFGCPKDEKVAAFYFRMAADLGHPDAQYALAKCYQHGLGVERDLKLATFYYHRAAAPDDDQPSWLYTNKSCSSSR